MAVAAAHRLSRDEVIWAFGPDLEPVLEVDPGDTVTFETNDCFTGQIKSEDDLVTSIDFERVNSATGPVAVRGAEAGTAATSTTTCTATVRASTSPYARTEECSPSATCTRRWATARSASPGSRSQVRSISASTC